MNSTRWQQAVNACHQQGESFVLVTVIGASGSTPRDQGSKLVVTSIATHDSIGGGQLELLVTQKARQLLLTGVQAQTIEHYPLASKAGQCCGGAVNVLYEVFPCARLDVTLFGAGHVARALVTILAACDTRIRWIDSRPALFPETVPANVSVQVLAEPESIISELPGSTHVLILTHDHALDYRLLHELLDATDIGYIGLIGSATKARRFRQRLTHDGFDAATQARCVCPVGDLRVTGKLPMEVAVSISTQLLSLQTQAPSSARRGVSWRDIKSVLNASS